MKKTKMISLDSSSKKTGFAYFENGILVESGVLDHSKEKDTEIRLEDICLDVISVLNKHKPEIVVIEMTVVPRNAQTQRILSEIVGVVRGWSLCNYAEFVRYRPSEWRKLICGEGIAPYKREEAKKWAIQIVKEDFQKICSDDEADAILIGQARINQFKNQASN